MKKKLTNLLLLLTVPLLLHAAEPPNILFILTDDQGYGDLSLHGNPLLQTPSIDRLGREGVRLERFNASPVCAPTRASLMTGRCAMRTNTRGVVPMYLATMRTEETTLAEVLKSNGYQTGLFGKWHLGSYYPYHPNVQGFDVFVGFRGGATPLYFTPVLEYNKLPGAHYRFDPPVVTDRRHVFFDEMHGRSVQFEGYITDILTDRAIQFMEENNPATSGKPFFCYLAYNAPHTPVQVPDRYFDKYKAMDLEDFTAGVYGMVAAVDDNVGRLIQYLEKSGQAENTVVVFMTDNGAVGTDTRYNAGMKGYKGSVDEGGCRVPFFVRWPGHLPAGSTVDRLTGHIDVLPTLLELCGLPIPGNLNLDGTSFAALLRDPNAAWPERMLFQTMNTQSEEREWTIAKHAVRTPQWRLTQAAGEPAMLYDMKADFGQTMDVAAKHPKVVKALNHEYHSWQRDVLRDGLVRPAIQIGHDVEPVVDLTSRFVYLHGNVSITGAKPWDRRQVLKWKSPDDYVWWDIEVVEAGKYRASITYTGSAENDGTEIYLERNHRQLLGAKLKYDPYTVATPDPYERVPTGLLEITTRTTQPLGVVELEKGRANLYLKARRLVGEKAFRTMKITLEKRGVEGTHE